MYDLNRSIIHILYVLIVAFLGSGLIELVRPNMRSYYVFVSSVALLLGLASCIEFDKSAVGFQMLTTWNIPYITGLTFSLGVDGVSTLFLLLTLFIFPICFASSWNVAENRNMFYRYLLAMEILLVLTFTTLDLFYFYVFFESLLIPMFIMIGIWGARRRKIKAAYLFFLYTLFGSLIMLLGLIYVYYTVGATNYFVILNAELAPDQQKIIWITFFMAFAVKMPLYPFHIWLPEAHVEAPTVGSMILASLLLKLGGYGFLRFSVPMLPEGSAYFFEFMAVLSLLGVLYGSLSTIRQIDLKRVIAYSSVAHMNLTMLGLFASNQQGVEGAIYLMVAHGVVSTALFFCVGVLYDRYHTRLLRYYGGVTTVMPLFSGLFFAFTLANMSFPGTSNFAGELLLFLGVFQKSTPVLLFAASGIVLAAVYSVWLYNRVAFGTLKTTYIGAFIDLQRIEWYILFSLLAPMLLLGLSTQLPLGVAACMLLTCSVSCRVKNRYCHN